MTRTVMLTALVAFTLSPPGDARGDSLMLRSGKTVQCDFVKYADGRFHVLVSGKAESYAGDEVQALTSKQQVDPFDRRIGALDPSREDKLSKLLSTEIVPKGFDFLAPQPAIASCCSMPAGLRVSRMAFGGVATELPSLNSTTSRMGL